MSLVVSDKHNNQRSVRFFAGLLAASVLAVSSSATAVDLGGLDGARPDNSIFIEPEPWKEGQAGLPSYPDEKDLLEVSVDDADAGRTYYLDAKSLSVGADGVIRYTVVIVSRTGAKNVLFEGIRCDTQEYKTYAYGTLDNTLRAAVPEGRWAPISGRGATVYRRQFYEYYLCSPQRSPLNPEQVIQRVKHPAQNSNFLN